MDHDQAFKNLILDYPVEALEFFAQAQALTGVRIVPLRQEQLKERLGERFRELDVPLLVEWPDGNRAAVLFVVEEETEPRRFSIHRLAHYCLDLAELLDMSRVVPVVVFLHRGEFQRELLLEEDREVYLSFRFICCELARLPAEDYLDSPNIVARLNLPNMRHAPEQRVTIYARAMEGLLTLEQDTDKQRKYADFIDAYADLREDEVARYRAEYIDPTGEKNMGLVATLLEEGRREGRREGRQEGRQEGESLILRRLLKLRFGELPAWAETRLAEAMPEQLERWSERILTAATLEEVFG